jgi:dipeptidyl aminopeptidase/acylaminoacyl peptidase
MIPFFGASVYNDPAVYRAASPIEFIKQAKTPTFIYVGERDVECPAPQSVEYWHALHALGVPVKLVIYAGEGHHFQKLTDLEDLRKRILGWFDRYLVPTASGG